MAVSVTKTLGVSRIVEPSAGGGTPTPEAPTVITSNSTLSEAKVYYVDATSGEITVTLAAASTLEGEQIVIKKTNTNGNDVIIDGNGAETIDGDTAITLIGGNLPSVTLLSNGASWGIL
jgi:hypothetical protein